MSEVEHRRETIFSSTTGGIRSREASGEININRFLIWYFNVSGVYDGLRSPSGFKCFHLCYRRVAAPFYLTQMDGWSASCAYCSFPLLYFFLTYDFLALFWVQTGYKYLGLPSRPRMEVLVRISCLVPFYLDTYLINPPPWIRSQHWILCKPSPSGGPL